jgi:hypothetical protein
VENEPAALGGGDDGNFRIYFVKVITDSSLRGRSLAVFFTASSLDDVGIRKEVCCEVAEMGDVRLA